MNRTPSRWSISWQNARASRPSPFISNVLPVASCARTVTYCGRATLPRKPGTDKAALFLALLALDVNDLRIGQHDPGLRIFAHA